MTANPFLAPFATPFGLPPFDQIADDHFGPAFDAGLAEARAGSAMDKGADDMVVWAGGYRATDPVAMQAKLLKKYFR